jgi:hypothetical protein
VPDLLGLDVSLKRSEQEILREHGAIEVCEPFQYDDGWRRAEIHDGPPQGMPASMRMTAAGTVKAGPMCLTIQAPELHTGMPNSI